MAPGSIGVYSAGSTYNPAQVLRDTSVRASTEKIDRIVADITDRSYQEVPIATLRELIELTKPDQRKAEHVWDALAVAESVAQFAKLHQQKTGYLYVSRDRRLNEERRETQGILSGGEAPTVPGDKMTLFLLRTTADKNTHEAWWPRIRFPDGPYAFAFAV